VFDRIPLYVLSRAVFGHVPSVRETVRAQTEFRVAMDAGVPQLATGSDRWLRCTCRWTC
jgi:hypothetical protein